MRLSVSRVARGFLSAGFFAVFALGSLVIGLVAFPVISVFSGKGLAERRRRSLVRMSYRLFCAAARVTGLFRIEMDERTRRALKDARACVIAANHISLIDVVILIATLGDSSAIAKDGAARNPFYGFIVRSAFIPGGDTARVLEEASRLLAAGVNVIVFPEGTRSGAPTPSKKRLKRGAARIAAASGAKVLPVRLSCSESVLGKGQPFWDVGERTLVWRLEASDPIDPSHFPPGRPGEFALTSVLASQILQ